MFTNLRKVTILSACFFMVGLQTVHAQIPSEFENLQIFPKDITQQELMQNMRSFAIGLGVRCWYCHVGEERMPLSEFDFASDAKETKQIARVMIQMRQAINSDFLTKVGKIGETSLEVDCVTCHRGAAEPEMLEDVLFEEITANGIESGIKKYRALREQHYGGFTYNFGELVLNLLAERFVREAEDPDAAIALLKLNLEFYPKSWMSFVGLGEIYVKQGKNELALQNYEKAYDINPNPRLKQKIESMK